MPRVFREVSLPEGTERGDSARVHFPVCTVDLLPQLHLCPDVNTRAHRPVIRKGVAGQRIPKERLSGCLGRPDSPDKPAESRRPGRGQGLWAGHSLLAQRREVSVGGQSEEGSWRRWGGKKSLR